MPTKNHPFPRFAMFCGIAGLIACTGVLISEFTGYWLVDNYNPISETISDLAAGQNSWILDTGLQVLAGSMLAIAIALFAWNLDGRSWRIAAVLLAMLSFDIFLIAVHNEYGDLDSGGLVIHQYLVYFLGIAFALMSWLAGEGLGEIDPFWKRFSRAISIVWLVCAPPFFFIPDSWNGAYERFLGILFLSWLVSISWLLLRRTTPAS